MTLDVLTLGETMGVVENERVGPLRLGGTMRLGIAGAESTVAIGVARLGGTARWLGVVGDDEIGAMIRRTLAAEGVETDGIVVDPALSTGLMLKERRTAAVTRVRYHRQHGAGARLAAEHVHGEDIERAAWLHLSGITPALSTSAREAVRHAIDLAEEAGTKISLDLNYRAALWPAEEAAPELRRLAARSDLVLATLEESALLTGDHTAEPLTAARAIAALGPRIVVVKLGVEGAVVWDGEVRHQVPAHRTLLLDPVGAGDAFAAGLLADLAAGRSLVQALGTAATVAAINVSCAGDWEGLPTRADLDLLRRADVVR